MIYWADGNARNAKWWRVMYGFPGQKAGAVLLDFLPNPRIADKLAKSYTLEFGREI